MNFQNDINGIHRWCLANKPIINMKKTKYTYSSQHNIRQPPQPKIGEHSFGLTRTYSYLGVVLEANLPLKLYINEVRKNVSYKLEENMDVFKNNIRDMLKMNTIVLRNKKLRIIL